VAALSDCLRLRTDPYRFGLHRIQRGRRTPTVIAVEVAVVAFVVLAAMAITGPAWLTVTGLTAHGVKDFWQHRTRYVANTRWWPPFCATTDWVAAAILAAAIAIGADLG
jgi:hypothetical protein